MWYTIINKILNIEEFEQLNIETNNNSKHVKFYDKKVDVWSYGICLYELIFNMLPFSDIYDIHGLKSFFSRGTTQLDIYKNIDKKNIIDSRMKDLLNKMLTINPSFRSNTEELYKFINIDKRVEPLILDDSIIDIVNCKENVYQTNEIMKENVIKEPINIKKKNESEECNVDINIDSWVIDDQEGQKEFPKFVNSWDKINKASSLIMKISVDNNFMKWLLNKK